jgi:hypothetical protein
MPAFSHFFLKRRRALSKDSPSLTRIPGNRATPPHCGQDKGTKEAGAGDHENLLQTEIP